MSSSRDPDADRGHNGERKGFRRTQAEMEDFMSKRQKRSLFSMSGSYAEGNNEEFFRRRSGEDDDAMSRVTFIPNLPRASGASDDNPTDLSIGKNGRNGDPTPFPPMRLPPSLMITAASGSSGRPDFPRIPPEFANLPRSSLNDLGGVGRFPAPISSSKRLQTPLFHQEAAFQDRNSAVVRPMSPTLSSAERKLLEKEDLIVERIDASNDCSTEPGSSNIQDAKGELADSPLTHISSSISSLVAEMSSRVQPSSSIVPHVAAELPPPLQHEALLKSCEFCTQHFEFETELAAHINRFHQGVKKYFCFVCHKRFKRKQSLENHVNMIHSGNRGS